MSNRPHMHPDNAVRCTARTPHPDDDRCDLWADHEYVEHVRFIDSSLVPAARVEVWETGSNVTRTIPVADLPGRLLRRWAELALEARANRDAITARRNYWPTEAGEFGD